MFRLILNTIPCCFAYLGCILIVGCQTLNSGLNLFSVLHPSKIWNDYFLVLVFFFFILSPLIWIMILWVYFYIFTLLISFWFLVAISCSSAASLSPAFLIKQKRKKKSMAHHARRSPIPIKDSISLWMKHKFGVIFNKKYLSSSLKAELMYSTNINMGFSWKIIGTPSRMG